MAPFRSCWSSPATLLHCRSRGTRARRLRPDRRLASTLLGGLAPAGQVVGGVDESDMREGLWEVADQTAGLDVVLFRQQAEVVAQLEQSIEQAFAFLRAPRQDQGIDQPE